MIRFTFGVASIIVFCLILFQYSIALPKSLRFINISSTTPKRELSVIVNSTSTTVSPLTVGLYYLPLNESDISRHRPLKALAYGSKDSFGYPIGALLHSTPSEYAIPSDRTPHQRSDHAFKYFHEMRGNYHMDARYGRHTHAKLSNADLIINLRGIFAAWYVYIFITEILLFFFGFQRIPKEYCQTFFFLRHLHHKTWRSTE